MNDPGLLYVGIIVMFVLINLGFYSMIFVAARASTFKKRMFRMFGGFVMASVAYGFAVHFETRIEEIKNYQYQNLDQNDQCICDCQNPCDKI